MANKLEMMRGRKIMVAFDSGDGTLNGVSSENLPCRKKCSFFTFSKENSRGKNSTD